MSSVLQDLRFADDMKQTVTILQSSMADKFAGGAVEKTFNGITHLRLVCRELAAFR